METEASCSLGQARIARSDAEHADAFEELTIAAGQRLRALASCEYRAEVRHWTAPGTAEGVLTQWLQRTQVCQFGAWLAQTAIAAKPSFVCTNRMSLQARFRPLACPTQQPLSIRTPGTSPKAPARPASEFFGHAMEGSASFHVRNALGGFAQLMRITNKIRKQTAHKLP